MSSFADLGLEDGERFKKYFSQKTQQADISKENYMIFATDYSIHILDTKNSSIFHLDE
jgi:hypothetical protein